MNMNEQSYPYDPADIDYSDVFRDFPIQDTYPIHGHACAHNIFGTFDYSKLQMAVHSGYIERSQLRIALHPYTNPTMDTLLIYKDMGVDTLELEPYTSLIDLTPEALLEIQLRDWNWTQAGMAYDPNSYSYKSLYTPVKDIISITDWVAALKSSSRL